MRKSWPIPILLTVIVIVVYARLSVGEFSWYDDRLTIHQNPSFNPPTASKIAHYWTAWGSDAPLGLFIPLTYSLWGGLAHIAYLDQPDQNGIQLNPWVFHTANILLHAASTLVVYGILRRLISREFAACAGAVLFAVHPVQVEPVGWISGMKDLLCGLLSLLALLHYIRHIQDGSRRRTHYALATIAFVAAMLSKPTAMIVPALAWCVDWIVLRRSPRLILMSLAPWFALAIPCILWTRAAQPAPSLAPIWSRPLIALDSLAFYLGKLVAPVGLAVDYGRSPMTVIEQRWIWWTWLIPLAVGVAIMASGASRRMLAAAGAIFVAGVMPVLGFVPFLFQYYSGVADHYLYLSMLGPALALAYWLGRVSTRKSRIVACLLLTVLAVQSFRQTRVWLNDEALWRHNVEVNPHSRLANLNLGSALERAGKLADAEHYYRQAIRADSTDDAAHENLGRLLVSQGRADEAIIHFRAALRINPALDSVRRAVETLQRRSPTSTAAPRDP